MLTARDVQDAMLPLRAVTPVDAARVGGKALNCARLLQAGFPVPDGFVVLPDSERPVTAAALEAALSGFPPNALFAVRSSGEGEDGSAQSFAGIHLTLLKVPREGLLAAIEACQASAASEAAQAYRRVHGLHQHGSMAVLVQQMVPADAAGVAFTVDPVSGDRSHMVISGAWGLGEAVVSGRVDPDEFRVARVGSTAVDIRLGLKAEYLSGDGPSTDWQPTPGGHPNADQSEQPRQQPQQRPKPQWCGDAVLGPRDATKLSNKPLGRRARQLRHVPELRQVVIGPAADGGCQRAEFGLRGPELGEQLPHTPIDHGGDGIADLG